MNTARSDDDDAPLDPSASEGLSEELYSALRGLGRRLLGSSRGEAGLDPTDVAHECYMRLTRIDGFQSLQRAEFLALASTVMRRLLVDEAKRRRRRKRAGGERLTITQVEGLASDEQVDVLDLDQVLMRLSARDDRQARIVELRFFGGLGMDEIAAALNLSRRTVTSEWAMARAYLRRELGAN